MDDWNESIEKVVKNIGESSKGYKIMHITAARYAYFLYNYLMYLAIILGPLAGVLNTINTSTNLLWLEITAIGISFTTGIIMTIIRFGNFEEKMNAHKSAAAKYTSLEGNIRRQLLLLKEDRIIAKEYVEWVSNSFDDLLNTSPLLSPHIYEKYIAFAGEHHLHIPDEYCITIDLDKIWNKNVDNLSNIGVRKEENKENEKESHIEVVIEDKKGTIKREETCVHLGDLNRFSDPKMKYEMRRFMGL